ncbi:DHA2 family efflux MFS transporter permease subunit [Nonomuraea sp. NPDC049152]|uniref:DHA2 family efflux MFS transporter permease subunit n=1 Tax=Nonomuraea sp. NPDC049152 TaxID=3154350 RepID=UPI0033EF3A66
MSTPTSHAPPRATSQARSWAVLAVILAAEVLDLLDSTITNIAAPTIAADLDGGEPLIQWLGAGYALSLGVLLVVGGRLGDRYGRRHLFLIGLTGFTLASVACGLAPDPGSIVVARLVQGAFGALIIPQGFGILAAVFPRDQLGKVFSVFGPVLGLSAVGGPILAGFLIEGFGWRAMFLINILLGGAALIAAVKLLPKDGGRPGASVDALGSAFLGAAMIGLLYGLIDGSAHGWALVPWLSMAAGLGFFLLFCRRQITAAHPLIEPSLLRNRGFTSGLLLGVAFFAAVSGLLYVLSLYLQHTMGYTPKQAAFSLAPLAAGIVIASIACHSLIGRLGRRLIFIGLLITLAGTTLALVLLSAGSPNGWAVPAAALIIGLGMGTCFGTVYDVTIGDIDPDQSGSASGSLAAVQQLANAIGAAAVTTVYFQSQADGATRSLVVVAAVVLLCCGLVWLLPRNAQQQHH